MSGLILTPYAPEDLPAALELFYDTVHRVCRADYDEARLAAWAPDLPDRERWQESLLAHDSLVARMDGQIVGFGDLDPSGYLDRLYVRWDRQRQGIATALCDALEARAEELGCSLVTTHASITARPFFAKRAYVLVRPQQVERSGQWLTNYVMEKPL